MSKTIFATLVYIYDKKTNKVLMLHRNKKENDIHIGKYNGVGGKLEQNETPIDCAIRETLEETGLNIFDVKFKGHLSFPKFDKEKNDWFVFVYVASSFNGGLINCSEGTLLWIEKDKLLDLNLWETDKIFIPYLFTTKKFDGLFHYKDQKLSHNSRDHFTLY